MFKFYYIYKDVEYPIFNFDYKNSFIKIIIAKTIKIIFTEIIKKNIKKYINKKNFIKFISNEIDKLEILNIFFYIKKINKDNIITPLNITLDYESDEESLLPLSPLLRK